MITKSGFFQSTKNPEQTIMDLRELDLRCGKPGLVLYIRHRYVTEPIVSQSASQSVRRVGLTLASMTLRPHRRVGGHLQTEMYYLDSTPGLKIWITIH